MSCCLQYLRYPFGKILKPKIWLSFKVVVKFIFSDNVSHPFCNMIPNKFVAPMAKVLCDEDIRTNRKPFPAELLH